MAGNMENSTVAQGFAIVERGELLVASVSPTAIGAMVNWLVVRARVMVRNGTSDAAVTTMFQAHGSLRDASVRPVTIAVDSSQPRD